jgi:hypothetical protein
MSLFYASILNTLANVELAGICDKNQMILKYFSKIKSDIKIVIDVKNLWKLLDKQILGNIQVISNIRRIYKFMAPTSNICAHPIDVCIASIREVDKMIIEKMLRRAQIPVNHLIIDSTTFPLGKAREALIREVKTPLFVFLDDDVTLPDSWFTQMMQYWNEKVGWLEGYSVPTNPDWLCKYENYRLKKLRPMVLTRKNRGSTLDTIIRTDAVRDWRSRPDMRMFEDKALCDHAAKKGYKCLKVPVKSIHNNKFYDYYSHVFDEAQEMKKYFPWYEGAKFASATTLHGLGAAMSIKDRLIALNAFKRGLTVFRGYYSTRHKHNLFR